MKRATRKGQTGYALIMMVLLLMGIGGVVLAGFTQNAKQEAEHERFLHNQRVLKEAKRALLQFAYNYPVTANLGPGRLPNADTDNDGVSEGGATFGRLPWAQPGLDLYDIRDADGQRLWYAVSSSFRPQAAQVNSSSSGTITLRAQSGNVLFDGSNPGGLSGYGVAAVIIAPGPITDRNGTGQNRSVANGDDPFDYTEGDDTDEDTDPAIISAANYLDLVVGAEDNATFTNGSASDGLILGPVKNLTNDQFIVITAAEVIEMAEKATLQAYREGIRNYLSLAGTCAGASGENEADCVGNGGTWSGVYPWLFNYEGVDYIVGTESVDVAIDKLKTFLPADINFATEKATYLGIDTSGGNDGIFGRIPSLFSPYFTEAPNLFKFETQITGATVSLINPSSTDTYALTELYCEGGCPGDTAGGAWSFQNALVGAGPSVTFDIGQVLTDVEFIDIADVVGNDGRLSTTFAAGETIASFDAYFYDNDHSPILAWTACGDGADELSDCSRDSAGNPTPGAPNNFKSRILHMTVTLNFGAGVNNFDFDYSSPPAISRSPATAASHATISASYGAAAIVAFPGTLSATYEYERHWHEGDTSLDTSDPTYVTGVVDMSSFSLADLTLGIRYYPELPAWMFTNDWHNSIRMAYALEYEPPGAGDCIVDSTCLQLADSAGSPRRTKSLLVIAGQHDWQDLDVNGRLKNDLDTVFDAGNENDNPTFYRHRGNDKLLVIEEL